MKFSNEVITAVSPLGRVLSVILGLYGIIVVALITSIIVNFYTEISKEEASSKGEASNKDEVSSKDNKPDKV